METTASPPTIYPATSSIRYFPFALSAAFMASSSASTDSEALSSAISSSRLFGPVIPSASARPSAKSARRSSNSKRENASSVRLPFMTSRARRPNLDQSLLHLEDDHADHLRWVFRAVEQLGHVRRENVACSRKNSHSSTPNSSTGPCCCQILFKSRAIFLEIPKYSKTPILRVLSDRKSLPIGGICHQQSVRFLIGKSFGTGRAIHRAKLCLPRRSRAGEPRCAAQPAGAGHRRARHGQGANRRTLASFVVALGRAADRHELRGFAGEFDRSRAVRPRSW